MAEGFSRAFLPSGVSLGAITEVLGLDVPTTVNTKNWYREETHMWAEFVRRAPFGRRFSSKHSVEASAVRSTSSFGRRIVPRVKAESVRESVMTWIEYKEGDELMTGTRRA
jgi:hypothetical protein